MTTNKFQTLYQYLVYIDRHGIQKDCPWHGPTKNSRSIRRDPQHWFISFLMYSPPETGGVASVGYGWALGAVQLVCIRQHYHRSSLKKKEKQMLNYGNCNIRGASKIKLINANKKKTVTVRKVIFWGITQGIHCWSDYTVVFIITKLWRGWRRVRYTST